MIIIIKSFLTILIKIILNRLFETKSCGEIPMAIMYEQKIIITGQLPLNIVILKIQKMTMILTLFLYLGMQ